MHKWIGSLGFAMLAALVLPASAQTGAAVVGKGPGVAGAAQAAAGGVSPDAGGGAGLSAAWHRHKPAPTKTAPNVNSPTMILRTVWFPYPSCFI